MATIGISRNEPRIIARKNKNIFKPTDIKGKHLATQKASAVHFFLYLLHNIYFKSLEPVKFEAITETKTLGLQLVTILAGLIYADLNFNRKDGTEFIPIFQEK